MIHSFVHSFIKRLKLYHICVSYFTAEMHQERFLLGLRLSDPAGELTALPAPIAGKGEEGEEIRNREVPPSLLFPFRLEGEEKGGSDLPPE